MKTALKTALVVLAFASVAAAAATQDSRTKTSFTNIVVTGTAEVDGAMTVDGVLTVSSQTITGTQTVAGAQTVTGVITTSASTPYSIKISSKTAAVPGGTPTAAGLIAFDSTYVMYVSTGTGAGAWVKVGGQ